MGNNHEKNFSKDSRKILVLGIQKSGKTSFIRNIKGEPFEPQYTETKDLDMSDYKLEVEKKKYNLLLFVKHSLQIMQDLSGQPRQRVFWRHNFAGTQGVIFIIDTCQDADQLQQSMSEIAQLIKEPELDLACLAILVNLVDKDKVDTIELKLILQNSRIQNIKDLVQKTLDDSQLTAKQKECVKVFRGDCKKGEGVQEVINWIIPKSIEL